MLIHHITNFCDTLYRQHVQSNPCDECNHPYKCPRRCKDCLDEVHWPRHEGRIDYSCEHLLYYYTCRYSYKYCSQILYALEEIVLCELPRFDILSIGCGATPDLMAIDLINQNQMEIRYTGYDKNPLWKPIHDEIENYSALENENMNVVCKREDIFDVFSEDVKFINYNILVMQYFLSHLFNTQQISKIEYLYDRIIEKVVTYKQEGSPFVVIIDDIDSCYKGRDYFWLLQQKLEAAGYHTEANARCFKPDVHLEGATRYQSHNNKFSIPQDIKNNYCCAIRCESAQLIITIR